MCQCDSGTSYVHNLLPRAHDVDRASVGACFGKTHQEANGAELSVGFASCAGHCESCPYDYHGGHPYPRSDLVYDYAAGYLAYQHATLYVSLLRAVHRFSIFTHPADAIERRTLYWLPLRSRDSLRPATYQAVSQASEMPVNCDPRMHLQRLVCL